MYYFYTILLYYFKVLNCNFFTPISIGLKNNFIGSGYNINYKNIYSNIVLNNIKYIYNKKKITKNILESGVLTLE